MATTSRKDVAAKTLMKVAPPPRNMPPERDICTFYHNAPGMSIFGGFHKMARR